ncbi:MULTISPECIES: SHOCT domain-containing protein [Halorubrum]|uniref:SHOCT domain-containing protein n=1 Tax=Halorubrum tibetense TaxID=175631 RepID=A0ABD5SAB7_9EURY|nr:SHOCT domain-containing protein [Halorubrum alkaliphilum]
MPWSTDDSTVSETPIDRLKHQYVDGELTDAEFERRLERLVDADRERERAEAGPDHGQQSRYRPTDHERESIDRKR